MTRVYLNLVFVENKNSGNKLIRSCLKCSSESQSHCFSISFSGCLRTQGFLVPSPPPKYGKTILELHSRFFIHYDFWSELGCNHFITTWSPAEMLFFEIVCSSSCLPASPICLPFPYLKRVIVISCHFSLLKRLHESNNSFNFLCNFPSLSSSCLNVNDQSSGKIFQMRFTGAWNNIQTWSAAIHKSFESWEVRSQQLPWATCPSSLSEGSPVCKDQFPWHLGASSAFCTVTLRMGSNPCPPAPWEEKVEARTLNRILSCNRFAFKNKRGDLEKCLAVVLPRPQVWQDQQG